MLPPISIPIGASTRLLEKGLRRVEMGIGRAAASAGRLGKSLTRAGERMVAMGARMSAAMSVPIIALEKAAVTAFGKFDKAMVESLAITQFVNEGIRKEAEETAKTLSKSVTFAADELAGAYYYLLSAGLSLQQSIKGLGPVARFAQAGVFSLATATSLATDVQSAMGLKVKDAAQNMENLVRVTDALTKANQLADTSVLQVSEAATNFAATTARQYGQSLEEMVSVLTAFGEQGLKGQKAGMRYAMVMTNMSTAAFKNADAFRQAGIAVYDQTGRMRGMAEIIEDMERAFDGLSPKQQKAALLQLGFQERALKGIEMLIGFSDELYHYRNELENAGGTTEEVAKKQLEAFLNKMALMRNRLKLVAIGIGNILAPRILRLTEIVVEAAEAFDKWSMESKILAITLASIAALGPPLALAVGMAAQIAAFSLKGFKTLGLFLGPFLSSLASIPVLIAGALAAITTLLAYDPTKGFMDNIRDVTKGIQYTFDTVGDAVSDVVRAFKIEFGDSMSSTWARVMETWKVGTDFVRGALKSLVDYTAVAVRTIGGFLVKFGENMSTVGRWVSDNWNELWTGTLELMVVALKAMLANVGNFVVKLTLTISALGDWLNQNVPVMFVNMMKSIENVMFKLPSIMWQIGKDALAAFKSGLMGGELNVGGFGRRIMESFYGIARGETLAEKLSAVKWGEGWSGVSSKDVSKAFSGLSKLELNLDLAAEKAATFAGEAAKSAESMEEHADKVNADTESMVGATTVEQETTDATTAALRKGTAEAYEAAYRGSMLNKTEKRIESNTGKTVELLEEQNDLLSSVAFATPSPEDIGTVEIF